MPRYKNVTISSSSADRSTSNALSGIGERKRLIKALHFSFTAAATPQTGVSIVASVDQEEFVEITANHWQDMDSDTGQYLALPRRIPVDINLEDNQGFEVGFLKTGGSPAGTITIEYEDLQ